MGMEFEHVEAKVRIETELLLPAELANFTARLTTRGQNANRTTSS